MPEALLEIIQSDTLKQWGVAFAASLGALIVLVAVKAFIWKHVHAWTKQTNAQWDDDLLKRLDSPIRSLIFVVAIAIGFQFTEDKVRYHPIAAQGIRLLFILIAIWTADRLYTFVIRKGRFRISLTDSTRSLILSVIRLAVYSVTFLIVLDTLGISITPVLASLGVGSLAVALALQDTLSNFFSGLYILFDKPIRIGDFVELEENVKGTVDKIGWRSTHIRLLGNNTVVIPNSKVSAATLTNYNMPSREMSLLIQVGIDYTSDLEKVEQAVIGVGKYILESMDGGVETYTPLVRYHTFNDSSIDFTVVLRVKTYVDKFLVRHEFIKALHKKFAEEDISIPFPQRVLHWAPGSEPKH